MGLGGDRMAAAGAQIYQHYRHMAFMGVVAVLRNLSKVRKNFRIAKDSLLREQPDVLILIDYPSFNLKMAAYCRKHLPRTRIVYYIPPKIWAWKQWRVHKIARLSDEVLGIFPFEPSFYEQFGYRCRYVGNPTADCIRAYKQSRGEAARDTRTIAIFPGSRMSEITHCLPTMLEAARRFPDYKIIVCQAPTIDKHIYAPYLRETETLTTDNYGLMARATVAIVNSGTATLETALMGCPEVAVYHTACAKLLRLIWPLIFSMRHFTLVNILAAKDGYIESQDCGVGEGLIQEMLSFRFTADNVAGELRHILTDETYKKNMLAGYEHIHTILGDTPAAVNAARIIAQL